MAKHAMLRQTDAAEGKYTVLYAPKDTGWYTVLCDSMAEVEQLLTDLSNVDGMFGGNIELHHSGLTIASYLVTY